MVLEDFVIDIVQLHMAIHIEQKEQKNQKRKHLLV